MMTTIVIAALWAACGAAAARFWRKERPVPARWAALGPLLFPAGSLLWGDAGKVWAASVQKFGAKETLKGVSIDKCPGLALGAMPVWTLVFCLAAVRYMAAGTPVGWAVAAGLLALCAWVDWHAWRATFSLILWRVESTAAR